MNISKKEMAAVSAVMAYLEEEAACMIPAPSTEKRPIPPAVPRPWGVSGRQELMQHRTMMQLKAFHRQK
jgi:hypothetical protein